VFFREQQKTFYTVQLVATRRWTCVKQAEKQKYLKSINGETERRWPAVEQQTTM